MQVVTVRLEPGQLIELRLTDEQHNALALQPNLIQGNALEAEWTIHTQEVGTDSWEYLCKTKELFNITSPEWLPRFSGTVRYEAEIDIGQNTEGLLLNCSGAVRLNVDEEDIGIRVAPPYRFKFYKKEAVPAD